MRHTDNTATEIRDLVRSRLVRVTPAFGTRFVFTRAGVGWFPVRQEVSRLHALDWRLINAG